MAVWVHESPLPHPPGLIFNWEHFATASPNGLLKGRVRVRNGQLDAHCGSAQGIRTELVVIGGLVSDDERGPTDRHLGHDVAIIVSEPAMFFSVESCQIKGHRLRTATHRE